MDQGTVYLRCTAKDGGVSYTTHQVWDRERFISTTHAGAVKAGGKAEEITAEDYKAATGKGSK